MWNDTLYIWKAFIFPLSLIQKMCANRYLSFVFRENVSTDKAPTGHGRSNPWGYVLDSHHTSHHITQSNQTQSQSHIKAITHQSNHTQSQSIKTISPHTLKQTPIKTSFCILLVKYWIDLDSFAFVFSFFNWGINDDTYIYMWQWQQSSHDFNCEINCHNIGNWSLVSCLTLL